MFDQFAIVKIMEIRNEVDRQRWRKDEDAFYRDLASPFGDRFLRDWRWIAGLLPGRRAKRKTDRGLPTGPRLHVEGCGCDQAAR